MRRHWRRLFSRRLKLLESDMAEAASYEDWREAAIEHDEVSGAARWKAMDQSEHFDYVSIRQRLDELRALREHDDVRGVLFTLNEGIHGNLGGMGVGELFRRAKFGTKQVVSDYVEEVAMALEHIADPAVDSIRFEEKLDFFRRASHCFGRTALMMSGSGTLLYFHLGVAKAMWSQRLLPNIISGSSGGALVGALMCASSDDELDNVFDPSHAHGRPGPDSLLDTLVSFVRPQRITAEDVWKFLEKFLPDYTFQEAFEHTGRHMNVSIAPAEMLQRSRLLNSDTSPNVYLREAVLASTAVPGFFPPVVLMARNDKGERQAYLPSRKWMDGSLSDDLPAKRLTRLYGVNHYIVSQTNPFVLPFIDDRKRKSDPVSALKYAAISSTKTWINASAAVLNKPLSVVPEAKRLTNSLLSLLNQSYVGDITILPLTKLHNPLRVLSWRTPEEIRSLVDEGERATWPQLERIRIQTRISRILDRILDEYEDLHIEHFGKPRRPRKAAVAPLRRKAS